MIYVAVMVVLGIGKPSFGQALIPKYSTISPIGSFFGHKTPVSIAIVRFDGDALLDIKLFNLLKQDTSVLKRFTIFPYNVLQAQMSVMHLTTLDPNDTHTLNELRDQLGISLVVTGKAVKDGFQLEIISTTGKVEYKNTYLDSRKSTALKDAGKLFSANIKTRYLDLGDIKWVLVTGGTFEMGSEDGYSDERPVHTVQVKSFYMSAAEVTLEQYDAFCDAIGRPEANDSGWGRGEMPVSNIGWEEATAYCRWLSQQLGMDIHLPSEAQYEFAARGGIQGHGYRYSGSNYLDDVGWFVGNSQGRPHRVGSRMPNELGIYDLSGNVWEWCSDWYHPSYVGAPASDSSWNDQDMNTPYHVVRGGSWNSSSYNCRVSVRNDGTSTGWVNSAGFRLVRDFNP